MKNLFIFLVCMNSFTQLNAQTWIPQGHGLLPVGYLIQSMSVVDDSVIWVTASDASISNSSLPVPFDHIIKVLRSIDGGQTWESFNADTGRISFDIVAQDAMTARITTQTYGNGKERRLIKTEDGGKTWTVELVHKAAGIFLRAFDDNHLFCQNTNVTAWSADNGVTWKIDTLNELMKDEFTLLVSGTNIASVVGDQLWVGTSLGRIIRYSDYGASYEFTNTGLPYAIQTVAFADPLRGMLFYYDLNTGQFGLSRTFDGGTTWELTPTKPMTNKEYNIAYVPGSSGTFIAISDFYSQGAEYFWSTDFGETWITGGEIKDGETNAVQFLSPTLGWVSTGTIFDIEDPVVYQWSGDLSTSVKQEFKSPLGFEIVPNLATTFIQYEFDMDDFILHEQSILDLNGHLLKSIKTTSQKVDISDLPVGTYFLHVTSGDRSGTRIFQKVK